MDILQHSRVLMADSLGFHIIFVMFGLTFPILVVWFEYLSIRKKDKKLRAVAHFWSKVMTMLVITGVLSGTVIALQMSLVWPGILKFGGEVIGLPFMFETYAFLLEAIFLGLYMTTWNNKRISDYAHLFFGVMVVVGSTMSAYAITSVNGWMNLPTGFDIVDGKFENVDVAAAMFSTSALVTFFHSMPGYYVAAGLFIAGLYALKLLKSKKPLTASSHKLDYFIISRIMIFVTISFVASAITADMTGKYLASHEPEKLAAIELLYESQPNAPLIVGGVSDGNGGIKGPHIAIPSALSILACNSPDCVVDGVNTVPEDKRPPLIVHTFFDIKMTLITILVIIIPLYFILKKWHQKLLRNKLMLLGFVSICWFGIAIVELGWMMTEIGRQPWAVRGYLTTEEALTKTNDITSFGYLFPIAYIFLFAGSVIALKAIIRYEKEHKTGAFS